MAATTGIEGRLNLANWINIADATGEVLDTVTFREAIAVEG